MSGKAISFTEDEFSAMAGLPFLQRSLYMILRWYMDVASGRTGVRRGISYQSLAEELYVEPVRGRHASESGSPSKKAIRGALERLEQAGLIRSIGSDECLVFYLPKAHCRKVRPKDEGHMRGRGEGHDDGHAPGQLPQSFPPHEGHDEGHGVNRDEGHTSEVRVNPLSVVAAAAALPAPAVNKLSTAPLLLLQPSDIAEWVRAAEARRGKVVGIAATDTRIAEWLAKGIDLELLAEAYRLAVADRDAHQAHEPINPGFLNVFVGRVLKGRVVSKVSKGSSPAPWQATEAGIRKRAVELAVEPQRHGEEFAEFKGRVMFADDQTKPKQRRRHGGK